MAKQKTKKSRDTKRWSAEVTKHSDALDLESKVLTGARLLDATLKEEGATDKKLTKLAKSAISLKAVYVPRAGKKNESSLTEKAKELIERLTS